MMTIDDVIARLMQLRAVHGGTRPVGFYDDGFYVAIEAVEFDNGESRAALHPRLQPVQGGAVILDYVPLERDR